MTAAPPKPPQDPTDRTVVSAAPDEDPKSPPGPRPRSTMPPAGPSLTPLRVRAVGPPSVRGVPPSVPPRSSLRGLPGGADERFLDEGEVAQGGMSSIRRVVDRRLGRREAMKILDPVAGRTPRAAERFLREARITGALDHPNIVPVHDLGLSADGAPAYLTMKLVEGESFTDYLDRLGETRLDSEPLERSLQILLKVCDALSFAHGRGILHCDVKPTNIMVGSHGQVYLMDWGLAVATPAHAGCSVDGWSPPPPRPGTISGTPAFMSPEQAGGHTERLDVRTDVFGLGATLYRILTGRPPYMDETVAATIALARAGHPPDPESVVADPRLPHELCLIATKAMSKDPAGRHPSVHAFRHDLERFLRGGGSLPTVTFAEGEHIIREGEPAEAAYLVLDGVVEVYKTLGGKRAPLRLIGPGEVFGEAAVFSSQHRTASVVAKSDVTLKVVTAASLERELSKNEALRVLVRTLALRFREIDGELSRQTQPPPAAVPKG